MNLFRARRTDTGAAESDEAAAVRWVELERRGLSPSETAARSNWLAADPRRRDILRQIEITLHTLQRPGLAGRGRDLRQRVGALVTRRRRRRMATLLPILALGLTTTLAVWTWRNGAEAERVAASISVLPDTRILPDGSRVELNADAEIEVEYTAGRRAVRLVQGEALFAVEKDAQRPFVVSAGSVAVRAVGTAFAVRVQPAGVDVLVTEGRVAVNAGEESSAAADAPADRALPDIPVLEAGTRLLIPRASAAVLAPSTVSAEEIARALAWRRQRIEFDDTPLAAAVRAFERDGVRPLTLGSAAIGELRITGVFWTSDPEAFARALETSLGLRAEAGPEGAIELRR